jgi:single-strand DNA-binding protein
MAVCEFGLAVNRRMRTSAGEQREEVCFVDITAWGKQAETIEKYVKKGQPLFVEGRLTFDQWQSQDGQKRSKLRVTLERFQFLGGPRGAAKPGTAPGATEQPAEGPENSNQDQNLPEDDTIPF